MKGTKSMYMKCIKILFTILLVNTCICHSVMAINESTPGLSFEEDFPNSFSDNDLGVWKRYYGFYGAKDFGATQIVNEISNYHCYAKRHVGGNSAGQGDEDNDGWVRYGVNMTYNITGDCKDRNGNVIYTLGNNINYQKYWLDDNGTTLHSYAREPLKFRGTEPQGSFEIITQRTLDPNIGDRTAYKHKKNVNGVETYYWDTDSRNSIDQMYCPETNDFYTMPPGVKLEPGQNVVRIGSTGATEEAYSSFEPSGYYRRAMAERMAYSFVVDSNSTLLSYQYAAFLEDPFDPENPGQDSSHVADERPSVYLSVTIKKKGTGQVIKPVCSEYEASLNNGQMDFNQIVGACLHEEGNKPAAYKDWTNIVYDLREYIGDVVTIDVWIHDCLLELPVCTNCNRIKGSTSVNVEQGIPYIDCRSPKMESYRRKILRRVRKSA